MDWNDTPTQTAFRQEVREFIQQRLPNRYRPNADGVPAKGIWEEDRALGTDEEKRASADWVAALRERHWIAPAWPKEYGGAGLTPMEQFLFKLEMTEAEVPSGLPMAVGMLGPTLMVHGTEEQRQEHLPKILSGEVVWAQGYSEPGAGSDLASLTTRATRDGDEYVVNGQKIWTSYAHVADWLFVLVRTDPDAVKHRGISFLLMPRDTPGLSVRPLVNAAFEHHLNETFFDDVRVPVRNRVGEENRGWYVAMTLLDHERSNVTTAVQTKRTINRLIEYANGKGKEQSRIDRLSSIRTAIADRFIEAEVMFNFSLRIISMQVRGLIPNYEASVSKLFGSELTQSLANTGVRAFGLYGQVWDPEHPRAPLNAEHVYSYVNSIPRTIAAGSSEIQRGIIATRGLGLPRG